MKAMILAAGRGNRLRPFTDTVPKPLIPVVGKPLIVHHLLRFAAAGITDIVINVSYLAEQIQTVLGDGSAYGVSIHYSVEPTALETGGGICQALSLLGNEPFIVMSSDVWTDYPLENLKQIKLKNNNDYLAHLVMVNNPNHNTQGDFHFADNQLTINSDLKLTYSGFGIYHPDLFKHQQTKIFKLADLLKTAITKNKISAEYYKGNWIDVGTPERLQFLKTYLNQQE